MCVDFGGNPTRSVDLNRVEDLVYLSLLSSSMGSSTISVFDSGLELKRRLKRVSSKYDLPLNMFHGQ